MKSGSPKSTVCFILDLKYGTTPSSLHLDVSGNENRAEFLLWNSLQKIFTLLADHISNFFLWLTAMGHIVKFKKKEWLNLKSKRLAT